MKIIKDNTAKQYICRKCKSILEVSSKDLHTSFSDYYGVQYSTNYFYCPCCDAQNIVDTDCYE